MVRAETQKKDDLCKEMIGYDLKGRFYRRFGTWPTGVPEFLHCVDGSLHSIRKNVFCFANCGQKLLARKNVSGFANCGQKLLALSLAALLQSRSHRLRPRKQTFGISYCEHGGERWPRLKHVDRGSVHGIVYIYVHVNTKSKHCRDDASVRDASGDTV